MLRRLPLGNPASHRQRSNLYANPRAQTGTESVQAACVRRSGKRFEELASSEADGFLKEIASGRVEDPRLPLQQWFNELVYPLFLEACFADPIYGGNRGKVFWKMIGYLGLPAFRTQDMVAFRGKPLPGVLDLKSIQDFR